MTDTFLQSLRPEDVVHQRDQLARWWSQRGLVQEMFALQGRHKMPGWHDDVDEEAKGTQLWMATTFKLAELYWVSPEMTEVISTLAPSIPDCLPQPPVPDAFVMFAKSIPGTDADTGGEIFTSAFLWGTITMWQLGPCIAFESYAWRDLVHVYTSMSPKQQERWREAYPNRLMPTGGSEWPEGTMTTENTLPVAGDTPAKAAVRAASVIEDRRMLSTFWALASQRIVVETKERPYSRQVERQAERKGLVLPDVRVIRLRESPVRGASSGEGGGREYSHRWLVGSHWRNQWYAREQTHRPKLIEAYVKGPEDKPLKVRETVRALVR